MIYAEIILLILTLWVSVGGFIFWFAWAGVSGLMDAYEEHLLTPPVIVAGKIAVFFGLLYDVCYNTVPASILFWEPPREYTLSERLRRLVHTSGWRKSLAVWIALNLVNPFSSNQAEPHIKL